MWLSVYRRWMWPRLQPPSTSSTSSSLQIPGLLSTVTAPRGPAWCLLLSCWWWDAPVVAAQDIPVSIPVTRWPVVTSARLLLSWCPRSCLLSVTALSHCHTNQIKMSPGSCLHREVTVYYDWSSDPSRALLFWNVQTHWVFGCTNVSVPQLVQVKQDETVRRVTLSVCNAGSLKIHLRRSSSFSSHKSLENMMIGGGHSHAVCKL